MLVQGAKVRELEERLADTCGRRHAVACSSGTSALELALAALGIDGGEVLCPDLSWPSPAHAIVRSGATPVLFDVDAASWNGTEAGARAATSDATRAAILIDQLGMPAAHPIELDVPLISDAACSIGATVDGRPAPAFGMISCLSFHPRKLLTTGEGGACLTDDGELADALRMLRNHGRRDGGFAAPAGNHRMTEMAAAIGLAQLDRLDTIVERRRALAERYRARLPAERLQHPPRDGIEGNAQTFGVLVDDRDGTIAALRAEGIEAGRLSFALDRIGSLEGAFRAGSPAFDVAHDIEARGVALPLHPQLDHASQDRVIEALLRVLDP